MIKKIIYGVMAALFLIVFVYLAVSINIVDVSSYVDLDGENSCGSKEKFYTDYLENQYKNSNSDEDENEQDGEKEQGSVPTKEVWMDICDKVHTAWENQIGYYSEGGKFQYDADGDGSPDITVRTDCSGYVGYCLYVAGLMNSPLGVTSGSAVSVFEKMSGITRVDAQNLQTGDILVYSGHMEIFFADKGNGMLVYNWGSNASAKQHPTTSGKKKANITSAWRVSSGGGGGSPTPVSGKVVFLDAGHGCTQYMNKTSAHPAYGYAEGRSAVVTTFNGLTTSHDEDTWTELIRPKVKAELEAMGVTVRSLTDYTIPEDSLSGTGTKKQAARDWVGNAGRRDIGLQLSDASILVQIHSNAGGGNGIEIFTNNVGMNQGTKFLNEWDTSLSGISKRANAPKAGSYAFISNEAKPTYIIEVGFHDDPSDTYQMNHNIDNVAKALAESIYKMLD